MLLLALDCKCISSRVNLPLALLQVTLGIGSHEPVSIQQRSSRGIVQVAKPICLPAVSGVVEG